MFQFLKSVGGVDSWMPLAPLTFSQSTFSNWRVCFGNVFICSDTGTKVIKTTNLREKLLKVSDRLLSLSYSRTPQRAVGTHWRLLHFWNTSRHNVKCSWRESCLGVTPVCCIEAPVWQIIFSWRHHFTILAALTYITKANLHFSMRLRSPWNGQCFNLLFLK